MDYKKMIFLITFIFVGLLLFQSIYAEEVTINFASWQFLEPNRGEKLEDILSKFEKLNPDIKIVNVKIPFAQYDSKLPTEFQAGAGPDVFHIQDFAAISWREKQFLMPLNNLLDTTGFDEKFIDYYQSVGKIGSNVYAIPYESFCYAGLIINKHYLEEVGLDIPKTTEELLEASNKIEAETDALYGLIFMVNPAEPSYLAGGGLNRLIFGYGARVTDENGKFTVNAPEFIEAVKFMKQIYDSPGTPSGVPMGDQRAAFNAGKAAFTIDGAYYMAIIEGENPELYKSGIIVAPLPFPTKGSMAEVNWLAVNANLSDNKKEAVKRFIEYWTSEEVQIDFATVGRVLTGIKGANEALAASIPWFKPYIDALPYAVSSAYSGQEVNTPEIKAVLADYIGRILVGRLGIEEGLNTLQKELEKQFY